MNRLLRRWAGDPQLVAGVFVLSVFGIAMIYSAGVTISPQRVVQVAWMRQLAFFGIALGTFTVVSRIPGRWIEWVAVPAYVFSMVLLAATLVIGSGVGTAAGTKSTISLGPIGFQPAEIAKLATVFVLARYLASRPSAPSNLRDVVVPGVLAAIPLFLVLLQPDLGTAQAFVGILFATLFWAGTPIAVLLLLASPVAALILAFSTWVWSVYIVLVMLALFLLRYRLFLYESAAVLFANFAAGTIARPLWNSMPSYQQNRILVYLDPEVDPRNAGYQIIQSKIAIGNGGLWGKGFTDGTQKRYDFLPEQHTDFIFSVVGEELGFVGVVFALLCFAWVIARLVRLAADAEDPFAGLVLMGIFGAWLVHIFVNVGMTVGVVPITGIPLPFVSYGGTFLLISWVAVAIAVCVSRDEDRAQT